MAGKQRRSRITRSLAITLLVGGIAVGTGGTATAAPARQPTEITIPAGPLPEALDAFEAATDWRVDPAGVNTGAYRSHGVDATLPPTAALTRLLADTGLKAVVTGDASARLIAAADGETLLDPISVTAGNVTDREAALADTRRSKAKSTLSPQTTQSFNAANNHDALRLVPGVSYLHGAGNRFSGPSRIRGAQNWTIAEQIDGYPAINPAGIGAEDGGLSTTNGTIIPAIALESIEVHKGGLGVQYGASADGGLINNRIRQGRPGGPRGTVWVEGSAIAEQLLMADIGGATEDGRFDYYAAGKGLNGDYEDVSDQDGDALESDRLYSGITKLGYQPSRDSRLELLALSGKDVVEYTRTDGEEFKTTNTTSFGALSFEQRLDQQWSYDVGYTLWHDRAIRFSETQDQSLRDRPQTAHTVFSNAYSQRALSPSIDYSLALGGEYVAHNQREEADTSDGKDFDFEDASVYVLNSFELLDRLTLTGGLRALYAEDDFRDHQFVAHDLGAAYLFRSTGTTLRANHSSGYNRNKGFVYFFGPIEEAGGVKLTEHETSEIGVEQAFYGDDGRRVAGLDVAVFRTDYSNAPTFSGWGDGVVYYNDSRAEGVEVAADWQPVRSLNVGLTYTYLDTRVTSTTNPAGTGGESTAVPVPQNTAALGIDWRATRRLRLETMVIYDEGMRQLDVDPATGAVTVTENSDYTRWNMAAYYDLRRDLTVFVRGENLLDQEDLGYTQTVDNPDGTTTETDLQAEDPGRFFAAGLSYRW